MENRRRGPAGRADLLSDESFLHHRGGRVPGAFGVRVLKKQSSVALHNVWVRVQLHSQYVSLYITM